MFGVIDWVLDKIAPVSLTSDLCTEGDDYWQAPIVGELTREHNIHDQIMDRRISGEETLDG